MLGLAKTIITPTVSPTPEVQSEEGIKRYVEKITQLGYEDLCAEFSNVLAAKSAEASSINVDGIEAQMPAILTDLADKAMIICVSYFGLTPVAEFCGGEVSDTLSLEPFNELLNASYTAVQQISKETELDIQVGRLVFNMLAERLSILL